MIDEAFGGTDAMLARSSRSGRPFGKRLGLARPRRRAQTDLASRCRHAGRPRGDEALAHARPVGARLLCRLSQRAAEICATGAGNIIDWEFVAQQSGREGRGPRRSAALTRTELIAIILRPSKNDIRLPYGWALRRIASNSPAPAVAFQRAAASLPRLNFDGGTSRAASRRSQPQQSAACQRPSEKAVVHPWRPGGVPPLELRAAARESIRARSAPCSTARAAESSTSSTCSQAAAWSG